MMKTLSTWIGETLAAIEQLRGIACKIDLEINAIAHHTDNPDAPVKWPGAYVEESPAGTALLGLAVGGAKEPWHADWLTQVEAEAHNPLIAALLKMYRDQLDHINRMLKTELHLSTLEFTHKPPVAKVSVSAQRPQPPVDYMDPPTDNS